VRESQQIQPPKPLAADLTQQWLLKEDVAFLKPRIIWGVSNSRLNEQQKWRANY